MKYSLRSLMIVVTLTVVALAVVVLAGRIAYLSRYAAYHEGQAQQIVAAQGPQSGVQVHTYANHDTVDLAILESGQWAIQGRKLFVSDGKNIKTLEPTNYADWLKAAHHAELAIAYRYASLHCPWTIIDESSPAYSP